MFYFQNRNNRLQKQLFKLKKKTYSFQPKMLSFLILIIFFFLEIFVIGLYCPQELIQNGGFKASQTSCLDQFCNFDQTNFDNTSLVGWEVINKVQIGHRYLYNLRFPSNNRVIKLDLNGNGCIKQYINLETRVIFLKFKYAAIDGKDLSTCGVEVKINGRVYGSYYPSDYEINEVLNEFRIWGDISNSYVQFCGIGPEDNIGAAIDDISIISNVKC